MWTQDNWKNLTYTFDKYASILIANPGRHSWKKVSFNWSHLNSVDKGSEIRDLDAYVKEYILPYGIALTKNPPVYFCDVCQIFVPASGPRLDDVQCDVVVARYVQES